MTYVTYVTVHGPGARRLHRQSIGTCVMMIISLLVVTSDGHAADDGYELVRLVIESKDVQDIDGMYTLPSEHYEVTAHGQLLRYASYGNTIPINESESTNAPGAEDLRALVLAFIGRGAGARA